MRMGQGVGTGLGDGGITCVLQTQFSSLNLSKDSLGINFLIFPLTPMYNRLFFLPHCEKSPESYKWTCLYVLNASVGWTVICSQLKSKVTDYEICVMCHLCYCVEMLCCSVFL